MPTPTNTSDTTPIRRDHRDAATRQAIGEFSNMSRFTNGKRIAVRLTSTNDSVNPMKPEIGPSRLVNANSPSQTSAPHGADNDRHVRRVEALAHVPTRSGATPSMDQASIARLQ